MEPNDPAELILIISENIQKQLVEQINGSSLSEARLWPECIGLFRPDEGHIRLDLIDSGNTHSYHNLPNLLPCLVAGEATSSNSDNSIFDSLEITVPFLLLTFNLEASNSISGYYLDPNGRTKTLLSVELIGQPSRAFDRIIPVVDVSKMQHKKVAVIGLGSGGGFGAVELAKSGVGSFTLVDFDRLQVENISRHTCGSDDIGRWKTRAIRDRILQHSSSAVIECYEIDVTEQTELLEAIVDSVDLVFVATDNEMSKYMINEACISKQVTAVYGGVYERAFAGEVVLVTPDRGGCYACVRHGLANTSGTMSIALGGDYTDEPDIPHEPGLSIDVGFIANLHVRIALSALSEEDVPIFNNPDDQMIIWVNTAKPSDGPLFGTPLSRYFVTVPRVPDCRTCGIVPNIDELDKNNYE